MALVSRVELGQMVQAAQSTMKTTWWDPILEHQRKTTKDNEARGPCWVSRVTLPSPPEQDLVQVVRDAAATLGNGDDKYQLPTLRDVPAQWTGFRSGVTAKAPEPKESEEAKYAHLENETANPLTMLFAHGGAHYINGPARRRTTATKLAEFTKGKCLIVQHRLAPQNTFPAQILDVFVAYLSLLYPPPGSYHRAISASNLVFAGDSSGSQLQLAIIQIILNMKRRQSGKTPILLFHGRTVEVPLPAGVAAQSPGLDIMGTLPSWNANRDFDIFGDVMPGYLPGFPSDDAWPTDPPRGSYYCEIPMLTHPLVSPVMANDWSGAPPIYMAIGGGERVSDSAKYTAQLAARQGVAVLWDEYELMPHNWPMVFPNLAHSIECYRSWAEACLIFSEGKQVATQGTLAKFEDLSKSSIDVRRLTSLSSTEVRSLMRAAQQATHPVIAKRRLKAYL